MRSTVDRPRQTGLFSRVIETRKAPAAAPFTAISLLPFRTTNNILAKEWPGQCILPQSTSSGRAKPTDLKRPNPPRPPRQGSLPGHISRASHSPFVRLALFAILHRVTGASPRPRRRNALVVFLGWRAVLLSCTKPFRTRLTETKQGGLAASAHIISTTIRRITDCLAGHTTVYTASAPFSNVRKPVQTIAPTVKCAPPVLGCNAVSDAFCALAIPVRSSAYHGWYRLWNHQSRRIEQLR